MRRIGFVVVVLASLGFGAAGPAAAQDPPAPTVSFVGGDRVVLERANPFSPLPCKPSDFPGGGGYTGPCRLELPVVVDPPDSEVTVTVTLTAGTASGSDFTTPLTPVVLHGSGCVCLYVADDSTSEADETITATITDVVGGEVGATGTVTGTILDDDPPTSAPAVTVVERGANFVTVGWDPVTPVRGALTGYQVSAYDPGGQGFVVAQRVEPDVHQASLAGLAPGVDFRFDVQPLTSTEGPGSTGSVVAAIDPGGSAPTAPGAPVVGSTTAGNGFVSVAWAPPVDDGGAPILAYSVVAVRGDGTLAAWRNLTPDARGASIAGLANGSALDVYVLVWNGMGPTSAAPVSVAPSTGGPAAAGPSAVPYIEVDDVADGYGSARVTWPAAPEHGQPVLGYSVIVSERIGGTLGLVEWRNVGPDVRSATFEDLTYCYYDVTVVPYGAGGFGAPMALSDLVVTPPIGSIGYAVCEVPPD